MRQLGYFGLLGIALSFCMPIFAKDLPMPSATYTLPTLERMHPIVRGDAIAGFHQLRLHEEDSQASYAHRFEPVMEPSMTVLPTPDKAPKKPRHLSLRDAIALALRNNPNVKTAELQRILDKFGLEISLQAYRVQWNPLTLTTQLQNNIQPQWSTGTGIAVDAPTGTRVSISQSNNLLGGIGSTQLKITQHLLKGFGLAFNNIKYLNALDTEANAKLTFKNDVIQAVDTVITTYRSLVQAYNALDMDEKSLQSQEETVAQSTLRVKAGQMAPTDLLSQQSNLESTKLQFVQQQNTVRDANFTFLTALGLTPSTNIVIDRTIVLSNTIVPSVKRCIAIALKHNINYLQELLSLKQARRALIAAENQRKWTLDVTSSTTLNNQRSQVGQPIRSPVTDPTVGVSLSVPIDNMQNKESVVSAKIQIENDKLTLEQTKETLVSNVMDEVQAIQNDLQQIKIAALTTKLQQKTLDGAKLRLAYGKTTVFEVNTDINSLLQDNISYISSEISYLNDVTTLYQTLGTTLDQWGITLRY